jgi:hypothetical protein
MDANIPTRVSDSVLATTRDGSAKAMNLTDLRFFGGMKQSLSSLKKPFANPHRKIVLNGPFQKMLAATGGRAKMGAQFKRTA